MLKSIVACLATHIAPYYFPDTYHFPVLILFSLIFGTDVLRDFRKKPNGIRYSISPLACGILFSVIYFSILYPVRKAVLYFDVNVVTKNVWVTSVFSNLYDEIIYRGYFRESVGEACSLVLYSFKPVPSYSRHNPFTMFVKGVFKSFSRREKSLMEMVLWGFAIDFCVHFLVFNRVQFSSSNSLSAAFGVGNLS